MIRHFRASSSNTAKYPSGVCQIAMIRGTRMSDRCFGFVICKTKGRFSFSTDVQRKTFINQRSLMSDCVHLNGRDLLHALSVTMNARFGQAGRVFSLLCSAPALTLLFFHKAGSESSGEDARAGERQSISAGLGAWGGSERQARPDHASRFQSL